MKAVVISEFGGPEVLQIQERERPKIGKDDVLIEVKAAGVNRPDVFQRKGNYAAPKGVVADIPGLEVAGIIVEVGENVKEINLGDRVMALVAGGGYSEFVAIDSRICIAIPTSISFEEAAGMPETIYTVWHNVFQRGKLSEGEKLLVHGGSGGIGSTAIQLGKLLGHSVYTTVGSDDKKQYVENLGASRVFNYKEEDFEAVLRDDKVNVVLDSIGGDYFNKNINVLQDEGRLVYINAMQGAKVELNLLKLMQKRITLTGSTLRNRDNDFKAQLTEEIREEVLPFIIDGSYKTHIYKTFDISEASVAHSLMESRDFMGKIILKF